MLKKFGMAFWYITPLNKETKTSFEEKHRKLKSNG